MRQRRAVDRKKARQEPGKASPVHSTGVRPTRRGPMAPQTVVWCSTVTGWWPQRSGIIRGSFSGFGIRWTAITSFSLVISMARGTRTAPAALSTSTVYTGTLARPWLWWLELSFLLLAQTRQVTLASRFQCPAKNRIGFHSCTQELNTSNESRRDCVSPNAPPLARLPRADSSHAAHDKLSGHGTWMAKRWCRLSTALSATAPSVWWEILQPSGP